MNDIGQQYQAERDRLELNRALDWCTHEQEFIVAGESLKPMTVQVWLDLLALNSPVLFNEDPTLESLIDYVWRNCKRHTNNKVLKEWRLYWIQKRITKTLNSIKDTESMVSVMSDHLKHALDEFPQDMNNATSKKKNSMPTVSGDACMIDEIAARYSIHPDEVLKMPLRKAFSLQRVIRTSTIPGYKLLEADSLRAIKSKYLESINNGQQ